MELRRRRGDEHVVVAERTFAVDGTYTVTLTVTDAWGDFASTTRVVTIAKPATNVRAGAGDQRPGVCGEAVHALAHRLSRPNGDTFTYLWNFGDGSATSTTASPVKTYTADGTYTITLTVTDAWGDAASTTRVLTITEPPTNVAPVAVIPVPSCTGRVCNFTSAGTADANGDVITYLWNWGDATATSTAAAASHTFVNAGTYIVTLTVTDAWGDAGSTTREITLA